jgi:hypothetical protein
VLVEVAKQLARAGAIESDPDSGKLPTHYNGPAQMLGDPVLPYEKTQRSHYPIGVPRDPVVVEVPPTRISLGISSLDLPRPPRIGARRVLGVLGVGAGLAGVIGLTWAATTSSLTAHGGTGGVSANAALASTAEVSPAAAAALVPEPAAAVVEATSHEEEPEIRPVQKSNPKVPPPQSRAAPRPKEAASARTAEPTAKHTATGQVLVTTPGGTATVLVGGREVGRTPARLTLPIGPTTLTLRPDQGGEQSVPVDVQPGGMALVTAPMGRAKPSENAP